MPIVNSNKIEHLTLWSKLFNKTIGKLVPYYRKNIVVEKSLAFDENIFKLKKNVFLIGYWQDLKYFEEIKDSIKNDLRIIAPIKEKNLKLFSEIDTKKDSVCLHIRRGDYLKVYDKKDGVGICSKAYYEKAIALIISKVNNPYFYIFTDDPVWAKKEIIINSNYMLIENNTEAEALEDFRLMKICKHFILSNSSFSWWAAWLAQEQDNIIIAPKIWRQNDVNMNTPNNWIRLE